MSLNTLDDEIAGEAAAAAIFDHIAQFEGTGWLTDQGPGDLFIALFQGVYHPGGAVDKGAFFIAGDQKSDRA